MSRVGWIFVGIVVLVVAAFVSMTRFGSSGGAPVSVAIPVAEGGSRAAPDGALRMPVVGIARAAVTDSWGDERGGGARGHHGTDIMAPAGREVVAAAPGKVEKLFRSHDGGNTVYVRSADGRWSYYYAHLAGYAPGLAEGQAVAEGDPIGFVGDTGNAGAGNYHLHFGLSRMAPGDNWSGGQPVNPYPLLAGRAPRR